jgi:large conductance mechanosensitive channel
LAFVEDFKKFAFKGNVVDLAVGVIIGGAFGKIVTKLVEDLVMPIVGLVLPSGDWRNAGIVLRHAANTKDDVSLKWGDFLGAILDFLVIALVLFIIVSKIVAVADQKLAKSTAEAAPATKDCPFCFEAIPVKAIRCKACTSELKAA